MRPLALMLVVLPALVACGTTTRNDSPFAKPNSLMEQEIANRVAQIPYLHREELINNLLWLSQAGEQAFTHLIEGLSHQDPKVRSNCAWVLGRSNDRRVIPYLRKLVDDPAPTVQLEAARQLVLLGDVTQCPKLIEGLDSDKVQVRYLCHEALKQATGRDFGYDHLAENVADRRRAVLQWRQWWSRQSGDPWFAKAYAERNGLEPRTEPTPAAPVTEVKQPEPQARPMDVGASKTGEGQAKPQSSKTTQESKQTKPSAREEVSGEEFEAILLGPEGSDEKEQGSTTTSPTPGKTTPRGTTTTPEPTRTAPQKGAATQPAPQGSGTETGQPEQAPKTPETEEQQQPQESPAKAFRPVTPPAGPTTGTQAPRSTTGRGH